MIGFIGLVPYGVSVRAQSVSYIQYNALDGLPSSELHGLHEDKSGVLWIASDRGMATFDGYDFQTVDVTGLSEGTSCVGIFQGIDDSLWISTVDGSVLAVGNGKATPARWQHGRRKDQLPIQVTDLIMLPNGDAHLRYKREYGSHPEHYHYSALSDELVKLVDKGDEVWKHASGGAIVMCRVVPNRWWATWSGSLDDSIHISNTVYHPLVGSVFGFYSSQTGTSTFGVYQHGGYKVISVLEEDLRNVYRDKTGRYWAYGLDGLFLLGDGNGWLAAPVRMLEGIHVTDILVDRELTYWVSTRTRGLLKIPSLNFWLHGGELFKEGENVTSLAALDSVLIGQSRDGSIGVWQRSGMTKLFRGRQHFSAWANSLFVNPYTQSVWFRPTSKQQVIEIREWGSQDSWFGHGWKLRNGDVLFGNPSWGVSIYRDGKEMINVEQSSLRDRVLVVHEDAGRNIWIGGLQGLYIIPGYNYEQLHQLSENFPGLQTRISDIQAVQGSALEAWVATMGTGLFYWRGDTCYSFGKAEGLSSQILECLFLENDSTLWVGAVNGLNRIIFNFEDQDPQIQEVTIYSRDDGLPSNHINAITSWQNKLWIATTNGLASFLPHELPKVAPPVIVLQELSVTDTSRNPQTHVKLEPDQRDVRFTYVGISHRKPVRAPFYRYQLREVGQGATEWKYTNNRNVEFSNLNHGSYVFSVQAQNKYGSWSSEPARCTFTIPPFFYETWWFALSVGFSLLGLIIWVFVRYVKRVRQDFHFQLKLRESELRLLRTQMSPHFMFNVLNSIQQVIFDQQPAKAGFYLSRFAGLMRKSLDFSRASSVSLAHEIEFLRSYVELEKFRFDKQLTVRITVDPELEKKSDQLQVPPLMIQPLLENAFKHGLAGIPYPGLLEVAIYEEEDLLFFQVCDNGRGWIDTPSNLEKDTSHALGILRDRLRLLQLPQDRCGLHVVDRSQEEKGQTGVKVTLWLPAVRIREVAAKKQYYSTTL